MKPHWLTIITIALSTSIANAPQSLAKVSVATKMESASTNTHYAYHPSTELVDRLQQYEQNISCQAHGEDSQTHHQTWVIRAIALQQQQRHRESLICLDRALSLQPSEQAWYRQGIALSHLKQYSQAAAAYQQAIKLNPAEHTSWYNLGNAYKHLGKHQQAIAAYEKVIALKTELSSRLLSARKSFS